MGDRPRYDVCPSAKRDAGLDRLCGKRVADVGKDGLRDQCQGSDGIVEEQEWGGIM